MERKVIFLKSLHPRSLASSIRLVHSGGTLITKEMAASLINSHIHKEEEASQVKRNSSSKILYTIMG